MLFKKFEKGLPTNKYYRSLMKRMIMIGFFLPFLPMLLVSGIVLYGFHTAYEGTVRAHIQERVLLGKKNIDDFLTAKLGDIRFIAGAFNFEELREETSLQDILGALQLQPDNGFLGLRLMNPNGIQIARAGADFSAGTPYAGNEGYRGLLNHEYILEVSPQAQGSPRLAMAVRRVEAGRVWVLGAMIDPETLNGRMENLRRGKTGNAFILNGDGTCVTKPFLDVPLSGGSIWDFLAIAKQDKEEISMVQRADGSGDEYIYATAPLAHAQWFLVYRQSASDALSGLHRARNLALATILLAGLFLAINALSLSRKMVQRIELADRKKQKMNEKMFQTAKLASIGELAAGIAHEINNPVAIMVEEAGWINDLLEEESFQETKNLKEFRRALGQIRSQGRRCKDITHKLLSFARKTDFRVQEVQLKALIEDIITIAGKRSDFTRFEMETDIQEDLPNLYLPQTELQQVLLNLINNALDAMGEERGTLSLSAGLEDDRVVIKVSDTGPGIPKEDLSRIFDPFFTTKPVGEGTGLGLSICYGIIKEMGGEISAHSSLGEGTTFTIRIPVSLQQKDRAGDSGNTGAVQSRKEPHDV
jgi:two-component system NtrC family sensor kinase